MTVIWKFTDLILRKMLWKKLKHLINKKHYFFLDRRLEIVVRCLQVIGKSRSGEVSRQSFN